MSFYPSLCKEDIRLKALSLGAEVCGFAAASSVDDAAVALYDSWIASGANGEMEYCAKYRDERSDPRLLLDGAKTVIVCAFGYNTGEPDLPLARRISRYAWGDDYHWVVKGRLNALGEYIAEKYGGSWRTCVDTAPIRERYWAQRAGLGFVGINNQLIIPQRGSYFFLGELLWTGDIEPDAPHQGTCGSCMACVRACPGRALDGKGGCDARRCISYLTIEHRGDLSQGVDLDGCIYGCDVCQEVCPHNSAAPVTKIGEFKPNSDILSLDIEALKSMTSSHYRKLVRRSAMQRAPLKQLLRNISAIDGRY